MGNAGNDLKKDFKNLFKHFKQMIKGLFKKRNNGCDEGSGCGCGKMHGQGFGRRPGCGCGPSGPGGFGRFPFFFPFRAPFKSPIMCLFYPKLIVLGVILATLLLCGVGFYGLIIIVLLMVVFILI